MPISRSEKPNTPHPHDEYLSFQSTRSHPHNAALSSSHNSQQFMATLASKPHSFSGAVLTPDHARSITTGGVLSLASALSLQAANAAQVSFLDLMLFLLLLVFSYHMPTYVI
jgi:hypothetical protein